ncbi:aldose epimerase family protein [Maritalea sp.]|uniref:aldose epimerase family protein n=1 Tax=Maritalea sp. TaxID=2003361 RepID=UPI003EF3050D
MSLTIETIGEIDNKPFKRAVLKSEQAQVTILSLGGITQSWIIPGPTGPLDVVLGYDDPNDYLDNPDYFGTTVGRVANRISGAQFELDGNVYKLSENGPGMMLHGGAKGLSKRNWDLEEADENTVRLTYSSPHLEEGFPGNVEFEMLISLNNAKLSYDIKARPDRPTPINFAQHNYYNLLGDGSNRDHQLQVLADQYTPLGDDLLPTGEIKSVKGTRFDFRNAKTLIDADPEQLGVDLAYVLPADRDHDEAIAHVCAPNGVKLKIWSDQPCLQTYSGNNQSVLSSGKRARKFGLLSAICLEPQKHSNAVNTPAFPSIICTPEKPYSYQTSVEISADGT